MRRGKLLGRVCLSLPAYFTHVRLIRTPKRARGDSEVRDRLGSGGGDGEEGEIGREMARTGAVDGLVVEGA